VEQIELSNSNIHYIQNRLIHLQKKALIIKWEQQIKESLYVFVITRSDGKKVVLQTNGLNNYKLLFEDYYEEFTDYLPSKESFKSLVDWFIPFLEAYLAYEYHEWTYQNKKTGVIEYKRLTFNDVGLGRRQLISYSPAFFLVKKLAGQYTKTDTTPRQK